MQNAHLVAIGGQADGTGVGSYGLQVYGGNITMLDSYLYAVGASVVGTDFAAVYGIIGDDCVFTVRGASTVICESHNAIADAAYSYAMCFYGGDVNICGGDIKATVLADNKDCGCTAIYSESYQDDDGKLYGGNLTVSGDDIQITAPEGATVQEGDGYYIVADAQQQYVSTLTIKSVDDTVPPTGDSGITLLLLLAAASVTVILRKALKRV